ncbi:MAG: DUF3313 family protein [Myxococcales bacterium]|nr:DUF3313 family protein [Myxococcales bacterium]
MTDVVHTRKPTARRNPTALGFALLTLWFIGHASAEAAQTPATETASGTLEDGLQRVPIRGAGIFWVRPGVDLRAYDRVTLKPVTLTYKKTPRHYRIDRLSTGVLLTERDLERLQQSFYQAFKNGLARGEGFGPAAQSDPGLLWVSTSLVDVVVHYNDEPAADELSFIRNYGEMTLRVEFSDSETGETIARFEERRTIGPSSDFINRQFRRDHYSYWSAVRANLSRWSELVRRRMHDQRAATVRF